MFDALFYACFLRLLFLLTPFFEIADGHFKYPVSAELDLVIKKSFQLSNVRNFPHLPIGIGAKKYYHYT